VSKEVAQKEKQSCVGLSNRSNPKDDKAKSVTK
jgi:hypothetical protein